jgi:hypothetical protein
MILAQVDLIEIGGPIKLKEEELKEKIRTQYRAARKREAYAAPLS